MKNVIMRLLVLLLLLLVVACRPESGPGPLFPTTTAVPPVPTLAPAQVRLGETVYVQRCASCHGLRLEGQPDWKTQNADGSFRSPPHDDTGHTWHHGDAVLLEAVRLGGARLAEMNVSATSPMPAFGDLLSEREITAVLDYIKSTWPDDIRLMQWEATLREQEPPSP